MVTLNRPEKKNAINRARFKQFRRHIDAIAGDETIGVVILRGAGDRFGVEHDLCDPASKTDEFGWLQIEVLTLEKLNRVRQIVIAQVHGWCFTGRLELALAMGVANRCVAGDALDETVMDMAHAIAANSRHSNAANKKLVYGTDALPLSQGLTHEIIRNEGFDPKAAERRQGFQDRKG